MYTYMYMYMYMCCFHFVIVVTIGPRANKAVSGHKEAVKHKTSASSGSTPLNKTTKISSTAGANGVRRVDSKREDQGKENKTPSKESKKLSEERKKKASEERKKPSEEGVVDTALCVKPVKKEGGLSRSVKRSSYGSTVSSLHSMLLICEPFMI